MRTIRKILHTIWVGGTTLGRCWENDGIWRGCFLILNRSYLAMEYRGVTCVQRKIELLWSESLYDSCKIVSEQNVSTCEYLLKISKIL